MRRWQVVIKGQGNGWKWQRFSTHWFAFRAERAAEIARLVGYSANVIRNEGTEYPSFWESL